MLYEKALLVKLVISIVIITTTITGINDAQGSEPPPLPFEDQLTKSDIIIIGSITEHTILRAQSEKDDNKSILNMKTAKIMDPPFPQINEYTPLRPIRSLLEHYQAVLVTKKNKPIGIITRADLLYIK